MYQIFVVEDELLIRQSIRNTIEHMQGPFSFCGEASDGEMALSLMQDLMPDILLTDIRMPFLDGFGLIQHLKSIMPWLKIIIISGYGDFEFAQKAISLGVDQYLLKPVRSADLIKTIENVAQQIESEKKHAALPDGLNMDEVHAALQQRFMYQLLYGGADTGTLLKQMRTLQLDLVRSHYLVAVCEYEYPGQDQNLIRGTIQKALESAEQLLCYYNSPTQLTLLAYDNDMESLNERIYQEIQILRHQLRDICPITTWVISNEVQRLGTICDAYKTASDMLRQISAVSAGQVINVSDSAQITADIVQFHSVFGDDFFRRLTHTTVQELPALLDEALTGKDGERFQSILMRYNALVDLMKITVQIMKTNLPNTDHRDIAAQLGQEYDLLRAAEKPASFRATAEAMLKKALQMRQDAQTDLRYIHVISRAEKYVAEHFCDPNMSLISVARHVGMSAAHFSTVFSQSMGRPFISYLTAMRIERAKELLAGTSMKLSDIAMEIGYNEPNYFSHVFRKMEGITPTEYRNSCAAQ